MQEAFCVPILETIVAVAISGLFCHFIVEKISCLGIFSIFRNMHT